MESISNNMTKKIRVYTDGGARGNPGPAASAFVVTEDGKTIFKDSKFLGVETNNVAEYTAVLLAIEWLSDKKAKGEIIINLDSQLVERQLNGFWKIKSPKLKIEDKLGFVSTGGAATLDFLSKGTLPGIRVLK